MCSMPRQMTMSPFATATSRSAAVVDRRLMRSSAIAAAIAAVVYGASPLTFCAVVLLAALLWWAASDLRPAERHWFLWTSCAAIGLRLAAVGLLPLIAIRTGRNFAAWFGDGLYNVERSIWLRDIFLGVTIEPANYFEALHPEFGRTSYQFVLAYLHLVFGPSPYGAHVFSILLYAVAVILLYRLTRRAYGGLAAMLALVALWYFPSLFAWSVSAMKEAEMACLSAIALVTTVGAVRARTWVPRLTFIVALGSTLIALQGLRAGALEIVAGGLAVGLVLRLVTLRSSFVLAALIALPIAAWVVSRPSVIARVDDQLKLAARHHIGNVWTPGASYRVLDDRFYNYDDVEEIRMTRPNGIATMTHPEMARFLVRASLAFFVVPELWEPIRGRVRWLVPQQVAWYAALLLAIPGLIVAWRRDPLVASLLAGSVFAGMAIIGPNSGNIATLIRHRDMVSPFVFVLAGVGAVAAIRAAAQRGLSWR